MIRCSISIAGLVVVVALLAADCAWLRYACVGEIGNDEFAIEAGVLPAANVFAFGLSCVLRRKSSANPFAVGFVSSGLLLVAFVATIWGLFPDSAAEPTSELCDKIQEFIYENIFNYRFDKNFSPAAAASYRFKFCAAIFLAAWSSTVSLPLLLAAAAGGLLTRAVARRFGPRGRAVPNAEAPAPSRAGGARRDRPGHPDGETRSTPEATGP